MNARRMSIIPVVLLALGLLLGPALPATGMPVSPDLVATAYFADVLVNGNLQLADGYVSADAAIHTPEGEFRGHKGAREFAQTLWAAFSRLTFTTTAPVQDGDLITVRWELTGINTGSYAGLEVACAPVAVEGVAIMRFHQGQITEQWVWYDRFALMGQIDGFNQIAPESQRDCEPDHHDTGKDQVTDALAVAAPTPQ